MRPYPATNRLLGRQRRRKRLKPGWFLVFAVLVGINAYLLFIRGLPIGGSSSAATTSTGTAPGAQLAATGPSHALDFDAPSFGPMRGVAGIRSDSSLGLVPAPQASSLRFSLEEAQVVAGLRSLEQWCHRSVGTVAHSDTFATALQRAGLSRTQVFELVDAIRGDFDFRKMRSGECFEILQSPSKRVERFIYRKSPLVSYRAERNEGRLVGRKLVEEADMEIAPIALRIHDSLYASMYRQGESPALVMMLVDIFAWDIDFYIDTHEGDSIRLLVEKLKAGDEFVRYGRILAAEYKGDIGVHRAFLYETRDGTTGYYDQNGDSLRKAFLKSPLKFTRVSSDFGMRVHPVLGFSRMHLGVDLAAPTGTPIWAPGDGVVTHSGYKGVSGKLVTLRHANGYETVFAHLHTIAKGTRQGARVTQKQVIGTVGSTGRSTGPHLHYGMKKNGKHINPFTQKFPPARPVPKAELDSYREHIAPLLEQLQATPLPPVTRTAAIRGERRDTG